MPYEPQGDSEADFKELVRAVRDLSLRLERLERRLDDELADAATHLGEPIRTPSLMSPGSRSDALESRIGAQWLNRIVVGRSRREPARAEPSSVSQRA